MKAHLIVHCGITKPYQSDQEAEIHPNCKWITFHGRRQKVGTESWGVYSDELAAEARAINATEKELSERRRALDAKLRATQVAALEAAETQG